MVEIENWWPVQAVQKLSFFFFIGSVKLIFVISIWNSNQTLKSTTAEPPRRVSGSALTIVNGSSCPSMAGKMQVFRVAGIRIRGPYSIYNPSMKACFGLHQLLRKQNGTNRCSLFFVKTKNCSIYMSFDWFNGISTHMALWLQLLVITLRTIKF